MLVLFLLSINFIAARSQTAPSCVNDSDCYPFLIPYCIAQTTCGYSSSNSDCDYLGTGLGIMINFLEYAGCTRTCSTNTDCSTLPTAKICSTTSAPRYCVECETSADCTAISFLNHNCVSEFCQRPNPTTDNWVYCNQSNYCLNLTLGCFDDSVRCWPLCTENTECVNSSCIAGADSINDTYGICGFQTSVPPSISSAGCSSNNDCTAVSASVCSQARECVPCSADSDCNHLTATLLCDSGVCSTCLESNNSGCTLLSASKCVNHACASCQTNLDCSQFSSTASFCDNGDVCSPCLESDNSGCSSVMASKCLNHVCASCQSHTDCSQFSSTAPFCDAGGVCSVCLESDNSGCSSLSASKCVNHACTSCQSNSDCSHFSSTAPFCDTGGVCSPCLETDNSGCTSMAASKCLSHACTSCQTHSDCSQFSLSAPFCDGNGVCSACTDNSGCTSVFASKCLNHTCTGCQTNEDCSQFNSTVPLCEGGVCSSTQTNNDTTAINTPNQEEEAIFRNQASGYLSDFRTLIITFSENLHNLPSRNFQFFTLSIQNLMSPQDFNYTWSQSDNFSIAIQIDYGQVSLCENILQVDFDPTAFLPASRFHLPTPNISVTLSRVLPLSPSEAVSTLSIVSDGAQVFTMITVSAAAIPAIFTTGIVGSVWNFISICQIVNYLMFMQLTWPENALLVFKIFAVANLQFIPNPFKQLINDLDSLEVGRNIPINFSQNGISGVFILDVGTSIAVWLVTGLLMIFSSCIYLCWKNRRRQTNKVLQRRCFKVSIAPISHLHRSLFWRFPLRTVSSSLISVSMCAFTQLLFPEVAQNWLLVSSSALAILSVYIMFIYLVALCGIIYLRPAEHNHREATEYGEKYGCLFEDYKNDTQYMRSFEVISFLRKCSFVLFLVSSQSTMPQVPLICINSFTYFGFLVTLLPYKERSVMSLNILSEGIISSIMICALILLNNETGTKPNWMSHGQIILVGWVIVSFCLLLIISNALFLLSNAFKTYRQWWRKIIFWIRTKNRKRLQKQARTSNESSCSHVSPDTRSSVRDESQLSNVIKSKKATRRRRSVVRRVRRVRNQLS